MDWFLMLILCAIAFVYQMKIYGTNGWDMLVTNISLLYLSMNQSWGYQSLVEWAMWCVEHVSLGNRWKLSIWALRHLLHLHLLQTSLTVAPCVESKFNHLRILPCLSGVMYIFILPLFIIPKLDLKRKRDSLRGVGVPKKRFQVYSQSKK